MALTPHPPKHLAPLDLALLYLALLDPLKKHWSLPPLSTKACSNPFYLACPLPRNFRLCSANSGVRALLLAQHIQRSCSVHQGYFRLSLCRQAPSTWLTHSTLNPLFLDTRASTTTLHCAAQLCPCSPGPEAGTDEAGISAGSYWGPQTSSCPGRSHSGRNPQCAGRPHTHRTCGLTV